MKNNIVFMVNGIIYAPFNVEFTYTNVKICYNIVF